MRCTVHGQSHCSAQQTPQAPALDHALHAHPSMSLAHNPLHLCIQPQVLKGWRKVLDPMTDQAILQQYGEAQSQHTTSSTWTSSVCCRHFYHRAGVTVAHAHSTSSGQAESACAVKTVTRLACKMCKMRWILGLTINTLSSIDPGW